MAIDSGPRSAPRSAPSRARTLARSLARRLGRSLAGTVAWTPTGASAGAALAVRTVRAARALARAARAYPRRNPMTFAYLLLILTGLLLLTKILTGPAADHLKITISTNPHNMAHAPLAVLLASPLFTATDSGLLSHLLIIAGGVGICMAALERRLGAPRTAAVFLLANTIATAVATSTAAAAIHSGRYPAKWWDGYDYGISYGVLAIAAAVTPLVRETRALRALWAAGVFAYPFVSAQWFGLLPNFATIGHETAAGFGLVAGWFLIRRHAPHPTAAAPEPSTKTV